MPTRRGFGLRALLALAALAVSLAGGLPAARAADQVTVFAAASLKNALDDINAAWKAKTGKSATISYAASSALAKQIEQGAPADVFISADLDWMDYLSDKNLTKPDTEHQPARQSDRAGRAEGLGGRGRDREGLRPRRAARRRQAGDGQRQVGAGRQIRQGGAGNARRLGLGRGKRGAGRERARGAAAGLDAARRRSASSTRPTPPPIPSVKVVGTFPEDIASADHLSGGPDRRRQGTPNARHS